MRSLNLASQNKHLNSSHVAPLICEGKPSNIKKNFSYAWAISETSGKNQSSPQQVRQGLLPSSFPREGKSWRWQQLESRSPYIWQMWMARNVNGHTCQVNLCDCNIAKLCTCCMGLDIFRGGLSPAIFAWYYMTIVCEHNHVRDYVIWRILLCPCRIQVNEWSIILGSISTIGFASCPNDVIFDLATILVEPLFLGSISWG